MVLDLLPFKEPAVPRKRWGIIRYFVFGMPVLFPTGTAMAFELMTYGLVIGLVYSVSRWKCIISLYRALIAAMIAGRIVWAAAQMRKSVSTIPGFIPGMPSRPRGLGT